MFSLNLLVFFEDVKLILICTYILKIFIYILIKWLACKQGNLFSSSWTTIGNWFIVFLHNPYEEKANGAAPNNMNISFRKHQRLVLKETIPRLFPRAQNSVASHYHNSFGIKAARLWNTLIHYQCLGKIEINNIRSAFNDRARWKIWFSQDL